MKSRSIGLGIVSLTAMCWPLMAQLPPGMTRMFPVMTALDADADDMLSEEEVSNAPNALAVLDADGSNSLTADELVPQFGRGPGGRPGGRTGNGPGAGPGGGRGPGAGQGPGGGGPAGMFQRFPVLAALDADSSGDISAAEMRDSASALAALDADQSGTLALNELMPRFGGRGGPGRGPRPSPRSLPVMAAIDRDADGEITSEELGSASAALRSLDSDGDGSLSESEMMPAPPESRGPGGGRPGGPPGGQGTIPMIAALDPHASGDLSPAEIDSASDLLAALDADASGVLTPNELMPAFGARGGGRGGRGFGGGPGGFEGEPAVDPKQPEDLEPDEGTATIPDRETFERLSYQGSQVMIDTSLIGLEFVKFVVMGANSDSAQLYFMNTENFRAHPQFMRAMGLGIERGGGNSGTMRGVLVYRPMLTSPSGQAGLYTYEFEPRDSFPFEMIRVCHDLLGRHSQLLAGNLAYLPLPAAVPRYEQERAQYEAANPPVFQQDEVFEDIAYLPLNVSEGFGFLRLMSLEDRPRERDVVLYESLPNEMPRVAGIITGFRQTPLSHVNLRAVQDGVPNAFINGAAQDDRIAGLIGKYVYYKVAADGYEIREATVGEVEAHFERLRPSAPLVPARKLEAKRIRPLSEVGFAESSSIGVKAANVAALGQLGFPSEVVPDGFAIPFYFYDSFMRDNDLYAAAAALLDTPGFATGTETRASALKEFRQKVKQGTMPEWMLAELQQLQGQFPEGQSIRLRFSTNNEDLPGFSGAGLYDSFTHHPDEGHIAKSVKQVPDYRGLSAAFRSRKCFGFGLRSG